MELGKDFWTGQNVFRCPKCEGSIEIDDTEVEFLNESYIVARTNCKTCKSIIQYNYKFFGVDALIKIEGEVK